VRDAGEDRPLDSALEPFFGASTTGRRTIVTLRYMQLYLTLHCRHQHRRRVIDRYIALHAAYSRLNHMQLYESGCRVIDRYIALHAAYSRLNHMQLYESVMQPY
jgi:hypothetical protein